ncbi:OprO/OprP family phosphate-selective porin [Altererythrobacter aquiaggeris]|uniref:OprO/OprP family phosphate-selective porin n=1 Tax=Aestuarierythrobacter aquiaggeris TaxID=1898396 RepID=UPI003016EDF6
MNKSIRISAFAAAAALGWAAPAQAQSASGAEALRAEMTAMREQMAAMAAKIDALEGELDATQVKAEQATLAATSATQAAATASEARSDVKVAELKGSGGWSFKPFGRLMIDAGTVNAPDSIADPGLGFANEIRRARIGVAGDIGGGFGYKTEIELADNVTEITDAIITYDDGGATITVGQHNNFQSLEELTSSRFISFMERAAFTDAFGFARRVGLSGQYTSGDATIQAGVFTDNIDDLSSDENNSYSLDGRLVFAPEMGDTQLHFGASAHYRDLNDAATSVRYRQRPSVHFTDTRFIDTRNIGATGETGLGLEGAVIAGPFHAQAEGYWQTVNRPGLENPTFFGGAVEAGVYLTKGDTRGYKGNKFDRNKPKNPVGSGGMGAVQLNVRYDYLDLVDAGIVGGIQNAYAASLVWSPTANTRFTANYTRNEYDMANIAAGLDRNYNVDAFAVRAGFDF